MSARQVVVDIAADKREVLSSWMIQNHLCVGLDRLGRQGRAADAPLAAARLVTRVRGRRSPGELQAGCDRARRDADRDQPSDSPAGGGPWGRLVCTPDPQ